MDLSFVSFNDDNGRLSSDQLLAAVATLPHLRDLRLANTACSDTTLETLAGSDSLRANLTRLDVSFTQITNIARLCVFTAMRCFAASHTNIGKGSGRVCRFWPEVESLDFSHTRLEASDVQHLAVLPHLRMLNVAHTAINDAALPLPEELEELRKQEEKAWQEFTRERRVRAPPATGAAAAAPQEDNVDGEGGGGGGGGGGDNAPLVILPDAEARLQQDARMSRVPVKALLVRGISNISDDLTADTVPPLVPLLPVETWEASLNDYVWALWPVLHALNLEGTNVGSADIIHRLQYLHNLAPNGKHIEAAASSQKFVLRTRMPTGSMFGGNYLPRGGVVLEGTRLPQRTLDILASTGIVGSWAPS